MAVSVDPDRWTAVDRYITDLLGADDAALEAAVRDTAAAGMPAIAVAAAQGQFLQLLALTVGARHILEIGTLGGYSSIWMARALPEGGRLISLEIDPRHAEVARASIARAGLAGVVEVRVGPALETLPRLQAEGAGPFDLVFIDADKQSTATYFDWAVELTRPGGLIVVDNVVRKGVLIETESDDPQAAGMRRFMERLAAERRVKPAVIQTVGAKGYDGFAIALVTPA